MISKIQIQSTNKVIIYNLLFNSNKLKHSFNINYSNNILTINKTDLKNVLKLLKMSYYTQNTFKLINNLK
jgi:hypothetical protein